MELLIHKTLLLTDNIGNVYVSRKKEESGFTSIKDCVASKINGLEEYTKNVAKGVRLQKLVTTISTKVTEEKTSKQQ